MPQLNYQQVQDLWIANGGDPAWAPLMAGIAWGESNWYTDALNPNKDTQDYSVGLWQINYFGSLREPRTAKYGSPEQLRADPNLQAKAAIDLFGDNGAGIGNWTNDSTWLKWVAAGRPQKPSAATVQSWINAPNLPAGTIPPGSGVTPGGGGSVTPVTESKVGCNAGTRGSELPIVTGRIGTACQLKALTGGLMVGAGISLMVSGAILLTVALAAGTKAGQAAAGVVSQVTPAGRVSGALGALGRQSSASRAIAGAREGNRRRQNARVDELFTNAAAQSRADRENPSAERRQFEANRRAARRFEPRAGEEPF